MKCKLPIIASLLLLVFFSSCSFQRLLKNGTIDEKFEKAMELYEKKDYTRTLQLFDQLSGAMRATDKAQKIAYYYPFCYYYQKDHTLASYYFKRFYTSYPNAAEAEECLYMSAYCNFLNSPEYSLDQSATYDALKDLQLFTNTFPDSKRVSDCNELMDLLRYKLEMKDYRIARMYYRMEDFAAAIQMFNNILKDYPDSPHKEELMFLIVKAGHRFAVESILDKQKERHSNVIAAYNDFNALYPASSYQAEAKQMKEKSRQQLEALSGSDLYKLDHKSLRIKEKRQ